MTKLTKLTVLLLTISTSLFADPFNSNLSASERSRLENGEVIIKNIDSMKDVCMKETPETKKILSTMKKLDPTYVAEIIKVIPYEGNEDLRDKINLILLRVKDYVGIPYYSERNKKWYDLYSAAEITNATIKNELTQIDCNFTMSPFGKFKSKIEIIEAPDYYFYTTRNMEKLVYHNKFTAVKPEKMISCITVFRDGDNWILYAIGGAAIPKLFFLEDRVETSFMNRIKTFCDFVFKKLDK